LGEVYVILRVAVTFSACRAQGGCFMGLEMKMMMMKMIGILSVHCAARRPYGNGSRDEEDIVGCALPNNL